MSLERMRVPRGPLLLECSKRVMTWAPMLASVAGLWAFADYGTAWVLAPALFAGGACHFIHDFFLGKTVRERLAAKERAVLEKAREARIERMRSTLIREDRAALEAILTLEEQVNAKILENQKALELTGTFASTWQRLVLDLSEAGLEAVETKGQLQSTAIQLEKLGAREDAIAIVNKTKILDERIREVRQRLTDVLAQVAMMETGLGEQSLRSISQSLEERLELAQQVTGEFMPEPEEVEEPEPEKKPRRREKSR